MSAFRILFILVVLTCDIDCGEIVKTSISNEINNVLTSNHGANGIPVENSANYYQEESKEKPLIQAANIVHVPYKSSENNTQTLASTPKHDDNKRVGILGSSDSNCRFCRCGVSNSGQRIVGGTVANYQEFPWQAIFYFTGQFFCGGSLISDRYIVSAGHCFADFSDEERVLIFVRLLEPRLEQLAVGTPPTIERSLIEVIVHPDYDPLLLLNDIALVQINEPVRFTRRGLLRPICLPDADENFNGEDGVVTGYGTTSLGGLPSEELLEVDIPILGSAQCRNQSSYPPELITNNMLCAGLPEGGKDHCHGDSGGPLQVLAGRRGNQYYLAGIVSFAMGCALAEFPGVYTKVTSYLTFIEDNTEDGCTC